MDFFTLCPVEPRPDILQFCEKMTGIGLRKSDCSVLHVSFTKWRTSRSWAGCEAGTNGGDGSGRVRFLNAREYVLFDRCNYAE